MNLEDNYRFQTAPVPGETRLDDIILTRADDNSETLPMLGYTRAGKTMNVKVSPLVGITIIVEEWTVVNVEVDFLTTQILFFN